MSTLTKFLVVLLSLFSIFLCGMIIVFVGNSNNYKAMYKQADGLRENAESEMALTKNQYDEQVQKTNELKTKLDNQIQTLQIQVDTLESEKQTLERLSQQYQSQTETWTGTVAGFQQSVKNLQASLDQTQKQLDDTRAQNIADRKNLNEITANLYEKMVQMDDLEAERRRLLEEKAALEKQVEQLAAAGAVAPPKEITPVTPLRETASPTPMITSENIQGLVTAVSETMVQLSVGSADGVKPNMVFHVTRGDSFLCDVVITDVDVDKSAGVLKLVVQRPQVGDTVSTQL